MAGVETVVGWVASPVIKIVFDKAQKYLGANYKWVTGDKEMVDELISTLFLCQATVQEVELITNNQPLADWLKMLKETVYEAEDVLDNIETKSIKDEVQGKTKNQVSKLACYSLSAVRTMVLSDKNQESLKKVVDKLKKLSTQIPTILAIANLEIKNKVSQTREVTIPRETISQPLEEVRLYGREDELDLILEIILSGSPSKSIFEKLFGSQPKFFLEKIFISQTTSSKKGEQDDNYHGIFVIPIVGMGGVGKTALAQAVYNNPDVQQTFKSKAWISVSNNQTFELVTGKILESLGKYSVSDLTNRSQQYLSEEFKSIINKRGKFLIVLDDIFQSPWDSIREFLSHGAPGSVVLITTQNQEFANRIVGNTVGAIVCPIALSALDSGAFWELFERFAFGNVAMSKEKKIILKSIGKKIADKLHGLPLAAKIIGNILNSNPDEHKWRVISKSEWWGISEAKSQILPSVRIGYEQLDACLRQCFAYCSLFPRNSLIEKDRLVHMWIANNFIQSDDNGVMSLEDIGRQCFDELVKKSFFQRAWDNKSYVMHELMHDLAVIVSSGECLYLGEGFDKTIPPGVRHVAVDTNNLEVIKRIEKHKNLRSFLYFGCCKVEGIYYSVINGMLSNSGSLRVLDLSYMCMEDFFSKPPPAIWNLQHLRFLDLSSTGSKTLTDDSSINLFHLQALYIQKCKFKELPTGINKLINLRHLYADEETIKQISGIGQLTNLQELDVFIVEKEKGHGITELENLRELRGTLRIENFENIKNKDEAKLANLVNKKHLDSIRIIANNTERNSNKDMEVLQELQPNKDIKDLTIESYADSAFPNYWQFQIGDHFPNLNALYLISCVNVEVLPPLGELPSLKHLHIQGFNSVKLIDSHLYGQNQTVFPLLEVLVLNDLFKCEKWTSLREGAREFFPHLSQLTIENNYTLRKAPLNLFRSTLEKLKICGCRSLISLGNLISNLSSITHLELYNYSESISLDPLNMPLLEDLNLMNCPELKIKGDLQSLTHLKFLKLVDCPELFSQYSTRDQQKGKGLQVHRDAGLRSLTHIKTDYSLLNHEGHQILGSLPSLWVLKFSKITQFTNNQNLWFEKMTALKEIRFFFCEFEHLPASLTQLPTLKKMALKGCSLKSLTDSMPPNLQELHLTGYSQNLAQLCKAYEGQDWQFISSILVIHIDDYTNRKDAVLTDAPKMYCMEIQKPQISDAIGRQQACASCGKIFEFTDLVLRNWE